RPSAPQDLGLRGNVSTLETRCVAIHRLVNILALSTILVFNAWGEQGSTNKVLSEPELTSIFPMGGERSKTIEAEVRGKSLDGAYAVWIDRGDLKAHIKRIEEIELGRDIEMLPSGSPSGVIKVVRGHRVLLQVEISP